MPSKQPGPHGPVSERFMTHHYGPSGSVPGKRKGLESIAVEGVWLRRIGDWVEVLVEIERKWRTIIREHFDGPFSHICEPTGIVEASYLEHDPPDPSPPARPRTIGETTYEKFKRLIDSLPESYQGDFMSHIIARFAEMHDWELRDILDECYDEVTDETD